MLKSSIQAIQEAATPARRCLIGGLLFKAGQSALYSWGKCNIYYYSYYKHFDKDLSIQVLKKHTLIYQYNTIPVAVTAAFVALLTVLSNKFAKKFGYQRLIRSASIIQSISMTTSFFMPNYCLFVILFLSVGMLCMGLTVFPILNCLWSHHPNSEGKITGLVSTVIQFSLLCYVLLVTVLCNPDNEQATLHTYSGTQTIAYFEYHVGQNAPKAIIVLSIISSVLILTGSMLISFAPPIPKGIPVEQCENEKLPAQVELAAVTAVEVQSELNTVSIEEALKTSQYKSMFVSQFVQYFFLVTIGSNFKSYSLSKYNDDHYITFIVIMSEIVAGCLALIWGALSTAKCFIPLFTFLQLITGVFVICVAATSGKTCFSIFYLAVSMFDKGTLVSVNPGTLHIYGFEVGTKIVPIINLSTFLALLTSPVVVYIVLNWISLDSLIIGNGVVMILTSLMSSQMRMTTQK